MTRRIIFLKAILSYFFAKINKPGRFFKRDQIAVTPVTVTREPLTRNLISYPA